MQSEAIVKIPKEEKVLNRPQKDFFDYVEKGVAQVTKSDTYRYRSDHCNVIVCEEIINEYSKDDYWHIMEVFDKVGKKYNWPSYTVFHNWIMSDSVPELTELFNKISVAKHAVLDYNLIKNVRNSENDYFKDKNGQIMFDESGKPIQNQPHLTRLKMEQSTISQVNMVVNPFYGKNKQEKDIQKSQASTAETFAQALIIMAERKEKDVSRETQVIEHEGNEE